jgi:endonuclease YncB( thermonuclease family)
VVRPTWMVRRSPLSRVQTYGHDGYERILAVVLLRPINVNVEMVQQGLAEGYRGAPSRVYCRDLRAAELQANRNRVRMWAQGAKHESRRPFRQRLKIRGD